MSVTVEAPRKVWTEAEIQALPNEGYIHEVVNGELIMRPKEDDRLKDFFASGTQICWIINPDDQCVEICHSPIDRKLLGSGALLDGERLLPGFQFPIAGLFKGWDWD